MNSAGRDLVTKFYQCAFMHVHELYTGPQKLPLPTTKSSEQLHIIAPQGLEACKQPGRFGTKRVIWPSVGRRHTMSLMRPWTLREYKVVGAGRTLKSSPNYHQHSLYFAISSRLPQWFDLSSSPACLLCCQCNFQSGSPLPYCPDLM